jgi:uncharacterized protein
MLLEFGFKNYFSFKEGAVISYKLDANCPQSISNGKHFSTALVVKGANASGKTNVLRALSFLSYFATASFDSKPESAIPVAAHFGSSEPSEFYVEFKINEITYFYELICNKDKVLSEKLFRKNERKTLLLERKDHTLIDINSNEPLNNLNSIKVIRSNASIISTAHQYGFSDLEVFYNFFKNIVSNVSHSGLNTNMLDIRDASEFLSKNENATVLNAVNQFIAECDVGISSIKIKEHVNENNDKEYYPLFIHRYDNEEKIITESFESSGTKRLYQYLPLYFVKLAEGGLLILDEFDIHLHPHILPKLIDLFINPEHNPNNAQLLISTHDDTILDLLGKYRTVLVNKEDNESYAYRLDELPGELVRNYRSIVSPYNKGHLGGVPKL